MARVNYDLNDYCCRCDIEVFKTLLLIYCPVCHFKLRKNPHKNTYLKSRVIEVPRY